MRSTETRPRFALLLAAACAVAACGSRSTQPTRSTLQLLLREHPAEFSEIRDRCLAGETSKNSPRVAELCGALGILDAAKYRGHVTHTKDRVGLLVYSYGIVAAGVSVSMRWIPEEQQAETVALAESEEQWKSRHRHEHLDGLWWMETIY